MVQSGTFIKLNEDLWPGCYYARSDANDVARVEDRTYICSLSRDSAGPTNNWEDPFKMRKKLKALFLGCMQGRTMYVLPYSMGPVGSPMSQIGVQLTDSPYVVVNMRIMARIGLPVFKEIDKAEKRVVPCMHTVGAPLAPGQKDVPWPCDVEKYIVHFSGDTRNLVVRVGLRSAIGDGNGDGLVLAGADRIAGLGGQSLLRIGARAVERREPRAAGSPWTKPSTSPSCIAQGGDHVGVDRLVEIDPAEVVDPLGLTHQVEAGARSPEHARVEGPPAEVVDRDERSDGDVLTVGVGQRGRLQPREVPPDLHLGEADGLGQQVDLVRAPVGGVRDGDPARRGTRLVGHAIDDPAQQARHQHLGRKRRPTDEDRVGIADAAGERPSDPARVERSPPAARARRGPAFRRRRAARPKAPRSSPHRGPGSRADHRGSRRPSLSSCRGRCRARPPSRSPSAAGRHGRGESHGRVRAARGSPAPAAHRSSG